MNTFTKNRKLIFIKKFLKKFGIVMWDDEPPLNPKQSKMISLLRQTVNNPKSVLTVDPIIGNCYVECNDYFIILTPINIDIYGDNADYTEINRITGDKLVNYFYRKVSERRIVKENKYKNSGLSKLDLIFNDIKIK
jgi:hypothetical protein